MSKNSMYTVRENQKANQVQSCPGGCQQGRITEIETDENGHPVERVDKGTCPVCEGEGHYGVACALCEQWSRSGESLDFHHWDYDKNDGILVCRACHDSIHGNSEAYPDHAGSKTYAANNAVERIYKERFDGDIAEKEELDRLFGWLDLPLELEEQMRGEWSDELLDN